MYKKIIIIIAFLIVLTACSTSKQGGSGTPEGLHITFLESQPRLELKQNEYFDIGLKLENKAECNIDEGEICVSDYLAESISGVQDSCQSFELISMDSKNVYFQDNVYRFAVGDLKSTIKAEAQYSCSIQLTPQVCVKPRIEENEGICKSKETLNPSTLGLKSAPITVTSIDKSLIPQKDGIKLEVAIHLKKMQKGESDEFNIFVEYEPYGELECRDLDRLNFRTNTENIINCEILVNVADIEENPLNIIINSNYKISESKQIRIIKEGEMV